MSENNGSLRIGWASADLTPDYTVMIAGQFHARVSEGVRDPLTATAMAFESTRPGQPPVHGVMVSCDLVCISDDLRDTVRAHLREQLPELDPMCVVFNATHTHTAPDLRASAVDGCFPGDYGVDLETAPVDRFVTMAAQRIADSIAQAWRRRAPAGIGFGLAHATVGFNRRICYYDGETRMYGGLDKPDFSHVEGGAETGVNVLCVWNAQRQLTGVVVNLACPSQVSESEFKISADYWHETREELRQRLGKDLFVLPQVSAAGDIAPPRPTTVPDWKALERMWKLQGIDERRHIALRIADAVTSVVKVAGDDVDWNPVAAHHVETVPLSRRALTEQDVREALSEAEKLDAQYQALREELERNPQMRQQPRWYVGITAAYRRMRWFQQVAERYEHGQREPRLPVEAHVLRLGDTAFATNPFEYYQDFGLQIKARSKAVQTFVVQLAGPGTYLPSLRAVAGKSYGAIPASTPVGPEGGRELVEWTVGTLESLWTR